MIKNLVGRKGAKDVYDEMRYHLTEMKNGAQKMSDEATKYSEGCYARKLSVPIVEMRTCEVAKRRRECRHGEHG